MAAILINTSSQLQPQFLQILKFPKKIKSVPGEMLEDGGKFFRIAILSP